MPRTSRPPSYRLHKARKCAVVTIHGRNHYLGVPVQRIFREHLSPYLAGIPSHWSIRAKRCREQTGCPLGLPSVNRRVPRA